MTWPDLLEIVFVAAGVILAVCWPLLRALVKKEFPAPTALGPPAWLRKTLILSAFGLVTGVLVLAWLKSASGGAAIPWFECLIAGVAWESTFEKIIGTSAVPSRPR